MIPADVPSPIDLQNMGDAREWERTAMERPWRLGFFDAFAGELAKIEKPALKVIELGSGPGFLALHLLEKLPHLELVLLDFSAAMHDLARKRLAPVLDRVNFIERNFKQPGWEQGLGTFDAVITLQAVHELRHKRYAGALHAAVKNLLAKDGVYMVCDHYCGEGGMGNDQLYQSLAEQQESLSKAGYAVAEVLVKGGRSLYRAS